MSRNHNDNYLATFREIVAKILDRAPSGSLNARRRTRLTEALAADHVDSYFSTEFERAGTNASLSLRFDLAGYAVEPELDDEGNEWEQLQFTVDINWPCHGTSNPGVCLARLEFYREVTLLAAEIEAEFGRREVWRLVLTAADIKERAVIFAKSKIENKLREIVSDNRANMRVGSERAFTKDYLEGVPSGTYNFGFHDGQGHVKKYTMYVTSAGGGNLQRTE